MVMSALCHKCFLAGAQGTFLFYPCSEHQENKTADFTYIKFCS